MPVPSDSEKHAYMFSDDMKFVQKAILAHPNDDSRFLTLRRHLNSHFRPGTWDLPGGNVLFGTLYDESLKNEIAEESGLEIKGVLAPLKVWTTYQNGIYQITIGFKTTAKSEQVTLSHEHIDFKWINKTEFMQLESADFLQELVNLAYPD
jgi:8-oxo-dGTP pyrophosphatase MutT (NUDIX family)